MAAIIREQIYQQIIKKYGNLHAASTALEIEYHRLYGCFYRDPPATTQDLVVEKMKLEVK